MCESAASELASCLCDNDSLQVLFLDSVGLGDEGAAALAEIFAKNKRLQRLRYTFMLRI